MVMISNYKILINSLIIRNWLGDIPRLLVLRKVVRGRGTGRMAKLVCLMPGGLVMSCRWSLML